jgi:hypothetical protein
MREKTIERLKNNKFPQTNTVPHKKMKEILQNNFLDNNLIQTQDFEEEFPYGHFVFDFRVKNYLVEVQGDFFHANPNTRHSGATHTIQKINISRDRSKKKFVEQENKYKILYFWEYDILNKPDEIELCLKKLSL